MSRAVHMSLPPNSRVINSSFEESDGVRTAHIKQRYNHVNWDEKKKTATVTEKTRDYVFKTRLKPGKTGVMIVGLAGNNGSTLVGGILANKHNITWTNKRGEQTANYFGSYTQSSTVKLGTDESGNEFHVPMKCLVPLVQPQDIVFSGWDICNHDLARSMEESGVFDIDLQRKLTPYMKQINPLRGVVKGDFMSHTMESRINHIIPRNRTNQEYVAQLRLDIHYFRKKYDLENVIVLNQASTERYVNVEQCHLSEVGILQAVQDNHAEISPSQMYAIAAILEGCHYINGSPQNTLVPGILELASRRGLFCAGDDICSGQTLQKTCLSAYLTARGMPMKYWASTNQLGNNDGLNLKGRKQFKSKEISKSGVLEDCIISNSVLYPEDEKQVDHLVTIDYMPYVKDDKRAIDEIIALTFMGGEDRSVIHHVCPDSLLASSILIDAILLTEFATRISYMENETDGTFQKLATELYQLSLLWKAPIFPKHIAVTNSFFKQVRILSNFLLATCGIHNDDDFYV
jgi:myo-inositol-1-phosphate synthase